MLALTASVVLARGTKGFYFQLSVQHALSWVVRCRMSISRILCVTSGLSSLRIHTFPTVLVKLEPEGRLNGQSCPIAAQPEKDGRVHFPSGSVQQLASPAVGFYRRLKYSQQDRLIFLCENSVSKDSAKLLLRERLRYYSQQVSSSMFAAKCRCSFGTGDPTVHPAAPVRTLAPG